MKIGARWFVLAIVLGGGLAGLEVWRQYLEAAGPLPAMPLAKPLASLPMALGDWKGEDVPVKDERLLYGDDHLQRLYRHATRGQAVTVWIVYSREGLDRGHHPEICMAVADKPEDTAARRELVFEEGAAPAQQYRFGRKGDAQWVFYWHYTLRPPEDGAASAVQRFYQRTRKRPASATLEVFAPETAPDDAEHAQELVRLLDDAVQPLVGPTAVRGSRRTPVTFVEGQEAPKQEPTK